MPLQKKTFIIKEMNSIAHSRFIATEDIKSCAYTQTQVGMFNTLTRMRLRYTP